MVSTQIGEDMMHFSVEYKFSGSPIYLYAETAYQKMAMEILIQLEDIISRMTEIDQLARLYTASQLLELKNETVQSLREKDSSIIQKPTWHALHFSLPYCHSPFVLDWDLIE
jgi:hypothetical protein